MLNKTNNFRLYAIILSILIVFFGSSCVTYNKEYAITSIKKANPSARSKIDYQILPLTLKVLQNKIPSGNYAKTIEIDAAKGEGESTQILVINRGETQRVEIVTGLLTGPNGCTIKPEIGTLGYVPVRTPSIVGFQKRANFPDPVIPQNCADIKKRNSQGFFYTVYIPREAPAGIYSGSITIKSQSEPEITIPVHLKVYNIVLPVTSFLKTRFNGPSNFSEPFYFDGVWTDKEKKELYKEYLKYRINTGFKIDMSTVFSRNNGVLTANWEQFDREVEEKMRNGISTFDIYIDVSKKFMSQPENKARYTEEYTLLYQHLLEKNWTDIFIWYNYDEPLNHEIKTVSAVLDWGHQIAPQIKNLITLGFSTQGAFKKMIGSVDIWVPHIHQYNSDFFTKRQNAGEEVWIYTCIQNAWNTYPDNWKIDANGTSHRALGWWLFKYDIQGYLYWGTGVWWTNNPWEDAATYPLGNGDGSMLYPPLDKKSLPYPSTRLHITRDSFEEFDLLTMLKQQAQLHGTNEEIEAILSGNSIIHKKNTYTTDDYEFIRLHKRILEILEEMHD